MIEHPLLMVLLSLLATLFPRNQKPEKELYIDRFLFGTYSSSVPKRNLLIKRQ